MPIWHATLNLKQYLSDEDPTRPEQVTATAACFVREIEAFITRLESSSARRSIENFYLEDLRDILARFRDLTPAVDPGIHMVDVHDLQDDFNDVLTELYDWADGCRVWIGGEQRRVNI